MCSMHRSRWVIGAPSTPLSKFRDGINRQQQQDQQKQERRRAKTRDRGGHSM